MQRVVAITGGFGALGRTVARVFADNGWKVALIDKAREPENESAEQLHASWWRGGVELTDLDAARSALSAVVEQLGKLDALVNVAGGFRWETLADGSLDTWDLMYRTNVRTAATASKAALDYIADSAEGGRIINIGAGAALKAGAGMGAYAASKSGVMRLTEALAEELKGRSVTVNAILPGIIDTPQNRKDMPDADFSRWVRPEEIADVILFLASGAASGVTGALIPVTGRT
ncbi:SDR family NAD(P)-dependent oxidoreductase (plasmid) [Paraburkholderia sprentiae WSM5005]|uniref:SDR family NAD(P)-dependent oxidoreductase n=1 Tax=Paraburkholderia sprentiae WSM5005 TaxID=754502 RepID=A0A1I9YTT0_9BURK|nr:SDR family NAD(P)-dependent oxidoreductase [Paraburkholderia sprentiae]APA89610.1 SDR family NAD(P)-dependent oxidoreductase [Paraburkholderia sprentiae WSM5005]